MSDLVLTIPERLIEEIAQRAAAITTHTAVPVERSPFLTTEEAAEFLRCSRQRIHDLLSRGKLSRLKEGRRTLILRSELGQLVQLDRSREPR